MTQALAHSLSPAELASHRLQLMKFALLHLRNRACAEDAVQETLAAALEGAQRFAGESALRTWLIGILKHKIVDHFRRESREAPLEASGEDNGAAELDRLFHEGGGLRAPPADWGDPEAALHRREFFEVLEAGLRRLPEKTARAFHLREVMGLSTEEICETLGISPANCWIMLYRARVSLRQFLEVHWFSEQR